VQGQKEDVEEVPQEVQEEGEEAAGLTGNQPRAAS
jgi:hypothetical protein